MLKSSSGLRQVLVVGSCERGNKPSSFIHFKEFLTIRKSLTFQNIPTHLVSCLSIQMKFEQLGQYINQARGWLTAKSLSIVGRKTYLSLFHITPSIPETHAPPYPIASRVLRPALKRLRCACEHSQYQACVNLYLPSHVLSSFDPEITMPKFLSFFLAKVGRT